MIFLSYRIHSALNCFHGRPGNFMNNILWLAANGLRRLLWTQEGFLLSLPWFSSLFWVTGCSQSIQEQLEGLVVQHHKPLSSDLAYSTKDWCQPHLLLLPVEGNGLVNTHCQSHQPEWNWVFPGEPEDQLVVGTACSWMPGALQGSDPLRTSPRFKWPVCPRVTY